MVLLGEFHFILITWDECWTLFNSWNGKLILSHDRLGCSAVCLGLRYGVLSTWTRRLLSPSTTALNRWTASI
eukprot:8343120-Ditylum_brightwellii.AAC.1